MIGDALRTELHFDLRNCNLSDRLQHFMKSEVDSIGDCYLIEVTLTNGELCIEVQDLRCDAAPFDWKAWADELWDYLMIVTDDFEFSLSVCPYVASETGAEVNNFNEDVQQ